MHHHHSRNRVVRKVERVTRRVDNVFLTIGWGLLFLLMLPVIAMLMFYEYIYPTKFENHPSHQDDLTAEEEEEEE